MSLICCPLQCGKFISSFNIHKNECPNIEKLGKYCQQCPYNPEHILSIKALKVHVHFCPNKPKSSIFFKFKPNVKESLQLKKESPPYDIVRPKKNLNQKIKNVPISLSEGSLKDTYNVYQRNISMINENVKRIRLQEKKLLKYYVESDLLDEKNQLEKNEYNYQFPNNGKVINEKSKNYRIIKKDSIDDKATFSTASEETLNFKKNFYW